MEKLCFKKSRSFAIITTYLRMTLIQSTHQKNPFAHDNGWNAFVREGITNRSIMWVTSSIICTGIQLDQVCQSALICRPYIIMKLFYHSVSKNRNSVSHKIKCNSLNSLVWGSSFVLLLQNVITLKVRTDTSTDNGLYEFVENLNVLVHRKKDTHLFTVLQWKVEIPLSDL